MIREALPIVQEPVFQQVLASSLATVVGWAFSRKAKRAIIKRDGGCVDSPPHLGQTQAAHEIHRRGPGYNAIINGTLKCLLHHYTQHIEMAGQNGLGARQNRNVVKGLRGNLLQIVDEETLNQLTDEILS